MVIRITNKQAKVSVEFLIGVIILVISFVVIIVLISLVEWNPVIDKETCHQSIVYRATAKIKAVDISGSLPLKCQTEKICLTMSGEDCGLASTKRNLITKVKLPRCNDGNCLESKNKIMEVFADSMISCHSMLGEGKLNFMPHEWISREKKYGLICSRIVFDKEAKEKIDSIGFGEFYGYLERKTINDKSYLDYLYPGVEARKFISIYDAIKTESEKGSELPDFKDWKINLKEEKGYAIIASITPQSQLRASLAGLGIGAGVGIGTFLFPGGSLLGAALIGGTSGGAVFWYNFDDKFAYSPPAIYPYDVEELKKEDIYSFEIAP